MINISTYSTTDISPLIKGYFADASFKKSPSSASYTDYVDFFLGIPQSNLYIINNTDTLNRAATASLLKAMLHQIPILMTNPPRYKNNVPHLDRELIGKRLGKMYIGNIALLDEYDKALLFTGICAPINYVLAKHERILAQAQLRSFFRYQLST